MTEPELLQLVKTINFTQASRTPAGWRLIEACIGSDSDADTGKRVEVEEPDFPPSPGDACQCDLCKGLTDGEDLDGGPVG